MALSTHRLYIQPLQLICPYFCIYVDWLIMMGWEWCLRTAAITGLLFIPWVNVSGEPWWWWCWLGITPDLSTRAWWQSYQQKHLEKVARTDEGMRILRIQYLWYVNGSSTCHEILWHGTSGFNSHMMEGVLQIFITLKNPSPHPGLNLRPLVPVASTLTITSPRRLWHCWKLERCGSPECWFLPTSSHGVTMQNIGIVCHVVR
jgi:hypothetical protein